MTAQKASAADAGCWVDGHWGQYGIAHMIERAQEYGYSDAEVIDVASRKLASMSPSDADEITIYEEQILSDAAYEVENWLNENVAPEGFSFGWDDGEFFLSSDDDWQEAAGEPCYVCGADHGASLCGWCDLCSDYHRSDELCANYQDEFYRGYEECADSDAEMESEAVEAVGWATSTLKAFERECTEFATDNASDLLRSGLTAYRAGCDFWLTRNRHGAGFWDEGYSKSSDVNDALKRLTDASHAAGEAEMYIGDDGLIYQAGEE